ncbi:KIX domain [Popillia japonica]|uniref:histone acetyltransferase n=1 Tax=Popillia japonica TaxID=7064 RepID=A0AAW1JK95_POPJA
MGDEAKRYEELLKNIAISDMLGVLMQMNLSGLKYVSELPSKKSLFGTKPEKPNISGLLASLLCKNPDPSLMKDALLAQLHAEQGHVKKEWQKSVTTELRNYHIKNIIQAVYPHADAQALLDNGTNDVVTYAGKVEQMLFEVSNSRSEYYKGLKEKICDIKHDLHDRKKGRNTAVAAAETTKSAVAAKSATATNDGMELIQKQLDVLLYANKNGTSKCSLPPNTTIEGVKQHIAECTAGDDCMVRQSSSLCDMINHWKACNDKNCPTCSPLRF